MLNDNEEYWDDEPVIEGTVEELLEEFKYLVAPTPSHRRLLELFGEYYEHNEKMMLKKNRAAGRRARKALLEIQKLTFDRRKEMLEDYRHWRRE